MPLSFLWYLSNSIKLYRSDIPFIPTEIMECSLITALLLTSFLTLFLTYRGEEPEISLVMLLLPDQYISDFFNEGMSFLIESVI